MEPRKDLGLSDHYRGVFGKFEADEGAFSLTWNWAAFFFGPIWYIVNGMWVKAIIYLFGSALLFRAFPASSGQTLVLLRLLPLVYWGAVGNYDYYLLLRKKKQLW